MYDKKNFPIEACFLSGSVALGNNGKDSKTFPVRLLARTPDAIELGAWGLLLVHDMQGFKLHKQRLPLDYAHDDKEVIGFLNHFDVTEKGLEVSGALVPYKDNDRATEIAFKLESGVPYEASIFVDHNVIEEFQPGQTVQVNGRSVACPEGLTLLVARDWTLRGVAVCPYGADPNTKTVAAGFKAGMTVPVKFLKNEKQEEKMSTNETPVVEPVQAEAAPAAVEAAAQEIEVKEKEAEQKAEAPEAEVKAPEAPADEFSRAEFKRMVDEFGAALAADVVLAGGDYAKAKEQYFAALAAENDELRKQLAAKPVGVSPVEFSPGEVKGKVPFRELFKKKN